MRFFGEALLVRELPASATEESIRLAIVQYTGLIVQRLQLASSKSYALAQMKSVEEACSVLSVFNKTVPYVDNCAVIVTFSRQSLNQILIMDNVNLLKSQSGITSVHIHEDPINSAAQLAQTAIQMVQMGRQNPMSNIPHHEASNPTPQSISTPFGYLQAYPTPNPKTFQLEPQSGYNYDVDTGFYYDPKTEYYYNPKTNQWMFWCSKYSTFISCEGGDIELKKRLQEEEKDEQKIRNSAVISAPPSLSANASLDTESSAIRDALKAALEQNQKLMEALKNQTDSAKSFILHPDLPKPSEDLPMHSCDPFNVHELTNHETLSNSRDHSMRSRDELPHESKSRQDIRSSKNLDHVKEKESDRRRHHSRESEDRHRRDISKRSHYVRDQASRSDQRESPDRMEIGYDTDENPIIGHSSWRNPTQNKYEAMSGIQRNENQRQTTNTLVSNTPDHLQKPNSYIDRFMDQSQISFNSRFPPPGTSTPNAQQMMTPSPFNTTHQLGPPTSQMTCRPNDSRPGLPQPGTSTPNVQQMMTPSPFSTTPHQMGPAIPPMLPMYPSMPLGTPWNNSAMPGPSSSAPGPWNTSNYAFGPPHFASAPLPPRFQVPCGVPQPFPGFPAPINPIAAQQKKKSRFEPTKNMKRRLGRAKLENEVKQRKKEIEAQKKEKEQKKMQLIQKEQEELKALNICFNCGGRNHQQFSCQRKPIGEQELQVILACARERLVREKKMISELKKQLGHINKYCRGDQVDSSIVKMVRNAVNKFSKIFFFHLQEDNLVDLSKNFARFEVMDSIESTTVDPVSIQLQDLCPDGIVRQRDLTLCSKCGGLGHSKTNCNQQKVPRELYEKMLQLVTAYRALVKEGKGRYKLKGIVNPRPRKAPEVVTLDDEEDDMGEAEELTDDEANGSADLVLTEVVEDESDTNDIVYVEHDENGVENEVNQDDEVVQAIVNLILDEIDGVEETVVPTSKNVELPFQDANKDDDSDIIIIS
ncbi:RNA-binding protein 5 [Ditylenchus destructor]|uniref:RNA-binding protein 5 n=1 Tax=Ditylenchus destructor TaxID=166010 RepID=A0AAD4MWT0_9BILA|nr:RNA-binding protein 5 [Ditylenchus destructor]